MDTLLETVLESANLNLFQVSSIERENAMSKLNPKRKVIDCRLYPSEKNCSLAISGTEEEVLAVAVRHAVQEHGHKDTPQLREELKSLLKDAFEKGSSPD